MTRFEKEIGGSLGTYWKKSAENELAKIRSELTEGKITIDEKGIARNCIGRVLMSDQLEMLTYITDGVDEEATKAARQAEVKASLEEYKANAKSATQEELT